MRNLAVITENYLLLGRGRRWFNDGGQLADGLSREANPPGNDGRNQSTTPENIFTFGTDLRSPFRDCDLLLNISDFQHEVYR